MKRTKKILIISIIYSIIVYSVFSVIKKVEIFEKYVENTNYSYYDNEDKAKIIMGYNSTKDREIVDIQEEKYI